MDSLDFAFMTKEEIRDMYQPSKANDELKEKEKSISVVLDDGLDIAKKNGKKVKKPRTKDMWDSL
ncbi:MAG: hypothetical protein H6766_02010 [Candidatus Peribacteria bacterium]|nr:MAG: hypothetical protein H6766_02010 [Candidatus Peribacteria bacterium]